VTSRAAGPFDVKLAPQPLSDVAAASGLGRMSLDKVFHGDLSATSTGEMLSAMGGVQGSAAYVALERVSGTLHGRRGTFVLQHTGAMNRGVPSLVVTVVPDSGTDALAGLTGTMSIHVDGKAHSYVFEYTLPDPVV
jgi:hypothetical protein